MIAVPNIGTTIKLSMVLYGSETWQETRRPLKNSRFGLTNGFARFFTSNNSNVEHIVNTISGTGSMLDILLEIPNDISKRALDCRTEIGRPTNTWIRTLKEELMQL